MRHVFTLVHHLGTTRLLFAVDGRSLTRICPIDVETQRDALLMTLLGAALRRPRRVYHVSCSLRHTAHTSFWRVHARKTSATTLGVSERLYPVATCVTDVSRKHMCDGVRISSQCATDLSIRVFSSLFSSHRTTCLEMQFLLRQQPNGCLTRP